MIEVIDIYVHDPSLPSIDTDQSLPFNSKKFEAVIQMVSTSIYKSSTIQFFYWSESVFKRGWQKLTEPLQAVYDSDLGTISSVLDPIPIGTLGYKVIKFKAQYNLVFEDEGMEGKYEFQTAELPVSISDWKIFDPDVPNLSESNLLHHEAKKLYLVVNLDSDLQDMEAEVVFGFGSDKITDSIIVPVKNGELKVILDPMPSQINPRNDGRVQMRYSVWIKFKYGDYYLRDTLSFGINPLPNPGTIKIKNYAVSEFPVFENHSTYRTFTDVWEILVLSLQIEWRGFIPSNENSKLTVSISIEDEVEDGILQTEEVDLSSDGLVFIEVRDISYFSTRSTNKNIYIEIKFNQRTDQLNDKLKFTTGFRPDRIIELVDTAIKTEDSDFGQTLSRTYKPVFARVHIRKFNSNLISDAILSVGLHSAHRSRSRKRVEKYTKLVAFKRLTFEEGSNEDDVIELFFGALSEEILKWNSVALCVSISYVFGNEDRLKEFKEVLFDIKEDNNTGEKKMLASSSSSSRRTTYRRRSYQTPRPDPNRISGTKWVNMYPTSTSLSSLSPSFSTRVQNFISMLKNNGANVRITTTRRPKERAYLMHYCVKIANDQISPSKVPSLRGVNIIWDHGNEYKSVQAAQAMARAYGIVYPPSLNSRHVQGRAIDMVITSLRSTISFRHRGEDILVEIGRDRPENNRRLWRVASDYFAINKSASDWVHWYD